MADVIDDLARIAFPHPVPGGVEPPDAFDDVAAEFVSRRADYAENLRTMLEATDEDPLLSELRSAATRRDDGQAHVRTLLAYGRHCTGARPDYTWETLAEAAGLPYSTARRTVTEHDVTALDQILGRNRSTRDSAWLNPPAHDAERDRVLLSLTQDQAALLVDTLRAAADTSDTATARELGSLTTDLAAARQTPQHADQQLSREASWHPANQLSRVLSEGLRQATRAFGPRPVVSRAVEITAALAHSHGGDSEQHQLLSHAQSIIDRAAHTSYPAEHAPAAGSDEQ